MFQCWVSPRLPTAGRFFGYRAWSGPRRWQSRKSARYSPSSPRPYKLHQKKKKDSQIPSIVFWPVTLWTCTTRVRCTWEPCSGLPTINRYRWILALVGQLPSLWAPHQAGIYSPRDGGRFGMKRSFSSSSRSVRSSRSDTETPASSVDIKIGKIYWQPRIPHPMGPTVGANDWTLIDSTCKPCCL